MNQPADALFDEASRLVLRYRIATCSLLQRQLGVGYAEAKFMLERIRLKGRPNFVQPTLTVFEISKKWVAMQSLGEGPVSWVAEGFFEVETGIPFSSIDLYCALIGSSDADVLSVCYGIARAAGARRADLAAMTLLDSIGDRPYAPPLNGLVLKITSDPMRLFGREMKQICAALRAHTTLRCNIALAIQYDGQGDDLVLEAIASRRSAR